MVLVKEMCNCEDKLVVREMTSKSKQRTCRPNLKRGVAPIIIWIIAGHRPFDIPIFPSHSARFSALAV